MAEPETLNKDSLLEIIRKRFDFEWFQVQVLSMEVEHELKVVVPSYNRVKALLDLLCAENKLEVNGSGLWFRLRKETPQKRT